VKNSDDPREGTVIFIGLFSPKDNDPKCMMEIEKLTTSTGRRRRHKKQIPPPSPLAPARPPQQGEVEIEHPSNGESTMSEARRPTVGCVPAKRASARSGR